MKATCPNCASTYKVADDKIPEVGAQIKCPKCNTLFVVRRPPPASVPPSPPGTASPPGPAAPMPSIGEYSMHTAEKTKPAEPESQTPYMDGLQGEAQVAGKPAGIPEFNSAGEPLNTDPRTRVKGVSAIRAQSSVRPKGKAEGPQVYRVRTARGLSYDFSDRESMIRWLRDRESIAGCEVAEPGKDWIPASLVMPAGPATGSMPVVLEEEPAYVPEPGESVPGGLVIEGTEPQVKAGNTLTTVMWAAAALSVFLLLFSVGATLTRYGVVNLSSVLPLSWVGVEFPGEEAVSQRQEVPGELKAEDPEKAYQQVIGLARRSLRSKRFSRAALEYNRALTLRPDSLEALEGLARAYNGLGDRERALAALKKAHARGKKEPAPKAPVPKEKG